MTHEETNHAMLYVTEFTMLDGTTRPPLAERCAGMSRAFQIIRNKFVDDELATALFRCAVEDWLVGTTVGKIESDGLVLSRWGMIYVMTDGGYEEPEYNRVLLKSGGETIHHRIVELAHSVLDAQEAAT
jgi:hypothetical protein